MMPPPAVGSKEAEKLRRKEEKKRERKRKKKEDAAAGGAAFDSRDGKRARIDCSSSGELPASSTTVAAGTATPGSFSNSGSSCTPQQEGGHQQGGRIGPKASALWQKQHAAELNAAPPDSGATWAHITSLPLAADTATADRYAVLDFTGLKIKPDHMSRPLLVCPNGYIYCEMTNPISKVASDFLGTMAEPISRPENIHEYQITVFSTYAAVSVGMQIDEIITNLNKFSKNEIPGSLTRLLRTHGMSFGRVKLVLRDNRHYIEAVTKEDLEYMLKSRTINEARLRNSMAMREVRGADARRAVLAAEQAAAARQGAAGAVPGLGGGGGFIRLSSATPQEHPEAPAEAASQAKEVCDDFAETEAPSLDPAQLGFELTAASADPPILSPTPAAATAASASSGAVQSRSAVGMQQQQDQAAAPPAAAAAPNKPRAVVFSFEVHPDRVGRVKEAALTELRRPLLSEYDFRRDAKNANLDIALKPTTKIRYYQERCMRKMFSNGRARSGIIVLPCGAGKTLVGIVATTTIRKSAVVLTTSAVAVDQWRRAYGEFSTIHPGKVVALTAEAKKDLPEDAAVLISTYTMMAYSGKRSEAAERILRQIRSREWGLLVFDEVQFAPAPAFRKVNDIVKSHCKLGLTATLVREDDLIHDLQWLIGPKLYEANWLELQEAGFLAKVQCSEVWCPMVADFFRHYLTSSHAKQRKLWVCNPNKLRVCEFLMRFHESRMDKVIVFSDNLFALQEVARALGKPFISGAVGMQERMIIISKFKTHPNFNTVFLSKVGDNAIDIPCANVIIQISFNFASRRQEAQRLGRILRPKPKDSEEFNAFFYSVVSKDTQEMVYADKRQQFIIDQGYAYKVLPMSVFPMENETLYYDDPQRQQAILTKILGTDDQLWDIEEDDVVLNDSAVDAAGGRAATPSSDPASGGWLQQPGSVGLGMPAGRGAMGGGTTAKRNVTSLSQLSGASGGLFYSDGAGGRGRGARGPKKMDPREMHPMFRDYHKGKK